MACKKRYHLGTREVKDGPLETMCGLKVLKYDTVIDPSEEENSKTLMKVKKNNTLCVTCHKILDAYAAGFTAGQLTIVTQFADANAKAALDITNEDFTFPGPSSKRTH